MIKKLKFLSVVSFIIILFTLVGIQSSVALTATTGGTAGGSSTTPVPPPTLSSAKDITGFVTTIGKTKISGNRIEVIVSPSTPLVPFAPIITVSPKASIFPTSGMILNFATPQTYIVTAEDKSTKKYIVHANVKPLSPAKNITKFTVLRKNAKISQNDGTISITLPKNSDVTNIAPTIVIPKDATISPNSGVARDFSTPQMYTVTAEDDSTKDYLVIMNVTPLSPAKNMLYFKVFNKKAFIDHVNGTISITLPKNTNVSNVVPKILIPKFATIDHNPGQARNFTTTQTYTVTAEDQSTKSYVVTLNVLPSSSEKKMTSFKVLGKYATIDETNHTIKMTLPDNADLTKIRPVITVSRFASVSPKSYFPQNFTNSQKYIVTAEDKSTQEYIVTFSVPQETIELITTRSTDTLFRDYDCIIGKNAGAMYLFNGETVDETKNGKVYPLSDVWATFDGTNWKKVASNTNMGSNWEKMIVKVDNTVYSFGSKYTQEEDRKTKGLNDNRVFKSNDMINWSYVGEMPDTNREFDKSVVYFKDKFWLMHSRDGVWSSSDGKTWKKETTNFPINGEGHDDKSNSWGTYISNSLGGYTINNKMFFITSDSASSKSSTTMNIYSTSDGIKWSNEGALIDKKNSSSFNISSNINPMPVHFNHDGKDAVWIVSSNRSTNEPVVINSYDGVNWNLISTSSTKLWNDGYPRYYSSVVAFNNKLWSIGGWDTRGNTGPNNNTNDVWSSPDGVKWTQEKPKGVSFPSMGDRWLAGVVATTGSSGKKVENLKINREYNATAFFTGKDEEGTILGKWTLTADNDKENNGDIIVSYFGFNGNDYKTSKNVQFSSLESLKNITIYANDVKVGSIASFKGPFYLKTDMKYAFPQIITLDKNITIRAGESVNIKLVADFSAPKFKNFEMRTWLSEIGFKDAYSTSCKVYTDDTQYTTISPGRNIYYKQ